MKQYKFTIHGNEYLVDIHGMEDDVAHLEVNGTPYDVEVHRQKKQTKTPTLLRSPEKDPAKPSIERRQEGSSHQILAPLPGNIQEIRVNKGDIVEKGQLLMVMEAMKMENRLLAERAGVVESILVRQGDAVLQGDILMEIV
ncbi:MAG: biotin/lipoyl-containing protein [Bacteroidales bacterium]